MNMNLGRWTNRALAALILPFIVAGTASRADEVQGQPQGIWLTCANGANYPIRPLAVSRENDLVTGYLVHIDRRHSVHLRLVPMGVGYRYAGRGVWLDGFRDNALLNFGEHVQIACTIEHP